MRKNRICCRLPFLVILLLFPLSCEKKSWVPDKEEGAKRTHFEIHQPDTQHPEDKVILWKTPARKARAFLLKPGTRVKVLKTVSGDRYGTQHEMYLVRGPSGREGWVPETHCKEVKGR